MAEYVKKAARKVLTPTQAEIDFFDRALSTLDKKGKKTEKSGCTMETPGTSGTSGTQQQKKPEPGVEVPPAPVAPAPVTAISVKLPSFWIDNPRAWFIQADSQFAISNITVSTTKFYHILSSLPKEVIDTVVDIVEEIGTYDDPYAHLKDRLLTGFKVTKWARMSQLIHHPGLGDLRPSQLMSKMLALLTPGHQPCEVVLALFMEKMPSDIRCGVALKDYDDPRVLAADADLLWDSRVASQTSGVGAVGRLDDCVSAVQVQNRSRGKRPRQKRPPPPYDEASSNGLCYYHHSWGKDAHKCRSPCTWSGNAPAAPHN